MEWTDEDVLDLIDEYRSRPCLWDSEHKEYKLHGKKFDAWVDVADKIGCTVEEAKKKMNSLLASFRRERHKSLKVKKTDEGLVEVYQSTWFAFEQLAFLLGKYKPNYTPKQLLDSEENSDDDQGSHAIHEDHNYDNEMTVLPSNIKIEKGPNDIQKSKRVMTSLRRRRLQKWKAAKAEKNRVGRLPDSKEPVLDLRVNGPLGKRTKLEEDQGANDVDDDDSAWIQHYTSPLSNAPVTVSRRPASKDARADSTRDDSTVFADHIASKHRKYSAHTKSVVEYMIAGILFNADKGHYEDPAFWPNSPRPYTTSPSPNPSVFESAPSQTPSQTPGRPETSAQITVCPEMPSQTCDQPRSRSGNSASPHASSILFQKLNSTLLEPPISEVEIE